MAKIVEYRKAIQMRREGKSFNDIKKEVHVSKSTLSRWLQKYPLTKKQVKLLRADSPLRIEKYRETMRLKRQRRLEELYSSEKNNLLPFSSRELLIAGLFLYWGEGKKVLFSTVSISNTDPKVLKFVIFWLVHSLNIPKEKIRAYVHLYSDMDINKEMDYWAKELNLKKESFIKPYIKASKKIDVDHKGYGHGTCGIMVYNTKLKEKILMSIKAVADFYEAKMRLI